jgi:hypothetical protein
MLRVVSILLIVTVIGVVLLTYPYSDSQPPGRDASLQPVLPIGTAGPENGGLAKTYVTHASLNG